MSDVRRVLKLFNEKAEKLNSLRFVAALRAGKGSYKIQGRDKGPAEVIGDFATVDELDAFVLTLRLIIQDNEPISIRRLTALYETTPEVSVLVERVRGIREGLNKYLDRPSPIVWQGNQVSRRHILDVFLYGGLAHSHRDKTPEYAAWMGA